MAEMKFIHGSSATPAEPESFEFSLFNYNYRSDGQNNKAKHHAVNSGLDAEGPGIYAFGQPMSRKFTQEQLSSAHGYAGKGGEGSVWGFTVDMTTPDGDKLKTADKYPADEIPSHEWAAVIEFMVNGIRRLNAFDDEGSKERIEQMAERWRCENVPPSEADFAELNKLAGNGMYWNENNPAQSRHIDDWERTALQNLEYADPAHFIIEECGGDFDDLAENAIDQSDHLWQTLKAVWNWSAVENRGSSYNSYNALFLEAVQANISDAHLLRVANVNHGHFYVIFDVKQIQPVFAEIYTHDIDKPAFSAMLHDMGQMLEQYRMHLEPQQLKNKLNEISRAHFGKELDDPVLRQLSVCRSQESFHSGLLEKMKDQLSNRQEQTWEATPGIGKKFAPASEPKPVVDEPQVSVRRSM